MHSEAQVAQIAGSIREFGFTNPVLIDAAGGIIAGHGRVLAARQLGLETVPAIRIEYMTEAQKRAYVIADNKLALNAGWDDELLALELGELQADGFDLALTGFDADELIRLRIGTEGEFEGLTDPDEVPLPPDEATTRRGDLWLLGPHRLLCGDSASAADVDRLLAGQQMHLINTDPPYNVKVEPRSNNAIAAGLSSFQATHHQSMDLARHPEKAKPTGRKLRAKDRPLANDFVPPDEFDKLLVAWFGNIARVLVPGGGFYIWGGYANCANYPPVLKACGLYFSQAVIWIKEHPVLTRKDFMGNHEWCFYGWREGAAHRFFGPANVTDTWPVKKVNPQSMVHLTEKPVELAARAIQYSSEPGENVLDLFGGSGSTLIACQQHARSAHLMEIDPLYCDVIITRWQDFTGESATLDGTGQTLAQVRAKRIKDGSGQPQPSVNG
jgi:DNA modification methylase